MRIEQADMCHIFRDKAHLQTRNTSSWWLPHFLPHHMPFTLMLSQSVYILPADLKIFISEETPDRTLCIHEHGLPHGLHKYPCPYANYGTISCMDSLDLSDISDYEEYMVTSSDEEIPGMEAVPYQYRTLVCLNICFNLILDYNIIYLCELSFKEQYHSNCGFLMILHIYWTIANLYFTTHMLPCKILSK